MSTSTLIAGPLPKLGRTELAQFPFPKQQEPTGQTLPVSEVWAAPCAQVLALQLFRQSRPGGL